MLLSHPHQLHLPPVSPQPFFFLALHMEVKFILSLGLFHWLCCPQKGLKECEGKSPLVGQAWRDWGGGCWVAD